MTDIREVDVQSGDDYPITQGQMVLDPRPGQGMGSPVEVDQGRKDLVQCLLTRVQDAQKRYEKDFDRMKSNLDIVKNGCEKEWDKDKQYVANITGRHVAQKTNMLYAKNPRVRARKADRVWYQIWDGNIETAKAAMQLLAGAIGGTGVAPELVPQLQQSQALVADIQRGLSEQRMLTKIGETLEILFHHFTDVTDPTFKLQVKQLVRRVTGTGVGYVKLGFQRQTGKTPIILNRLADSQEKLMHIEGLIKNINDGENDQNLEAEKTELELIIKSLAESPDVVLQEGLVFDFPKSWDVIPIGNVKMLKGFVGCDAVAERMWLTPSQVMEYYNVDLKQGSYKTYTRDGEQGSGDFACCYEYYDKKDGLLYTLCDGYEDFLEEPRKPNISIPQFFPYYTLSWNDIEHAKDVFPPSDVEKMKSQQREHNRQREALRQHRIANTPRYVGAKGAMEIEDKQAIMSSVPHEILLVNAIEKGMKPSDLIAPMQFAAIDARLYDSAEVYQDYLLVLGNQQANLGTTSGDTATESTIAENSRMVSTNADVDEMDDFLSALARGAGVVLLKEMSPETVAKIAGQFAVWPQWSAEEITEQLWLEVEAGSSGKPHQAVDLQNWIQLLPLALQTGEISPTWLAKETVKRMDDKVDLDEAIVANLPAIMVLNRQQQVTAQAGNAENPPEQQGPEGGDNVVRPQFPRPAPNDIRQGQVPRPGEAI